MSLNLRHKNLQIHTEPSHIQKNSTVTNKITTKTKTQNLHKCTQNPHKETWNFHGSFSSCRWRTSWKGWITKTSQDDRDKLPQEPEAAGNVSIRHLYFTRGIRSGWYLLYLMVAVRTTRRVVSRALRQNTKGACGQKSWLLRTSQPLALELDDGFLNWILVSRQVFVDRHFLMHLLQVFVNYGFTCSETRTLYFYSSQLLSSFYRGATGSALTGNMTEKTKRNRGNCHHTIRLQSSFFLQMHIKTCHTFADDNNQSESLLHRLICSVLPHFTCSRTKEPRKDYMEM